MHETYTSTQNLHVHSASCTYTLSNTCIFKPADKAVKYGIDLYRLLERRKRE